MWFVCFLYFVVISESLELHGNIKNLEPGPPGSGNAEPVAPENPEHLKPMIDDHSETIIQELSGDESRMILIKTYANQSKFQSTISPLDDSLYSAFNDSLVESDCWSKCPAGYYCPSRKISKKWGKWYGKGWNQGTDGKSPISGVACAGGWCTYLVVNSVYSGCKAVGKGRVLKQFSEENGGYSYCRSNEVVTHIHLSGARGDNLNLYCQPLNSATCETDTHAVWTSWFSEEKPNYKYCPTGYLLRGIQCHGGWCDNKRLLCQKIKFAKVVCPAGKYCPACKSAPVACPTDHYCPKGSASPIKCPALTRGYYCPKLRG